MVLRILVTTQFNFFILQRESIFQKSRLICKFSSQVMLVFRVESRPLEFQFCVFIRICFCWLLSCLKLEVYLARYCSYSLQADLCLIRLGFKDVIKTKVTHMTVLVTPRTVNRMVNNEFYSVYLHLHFFKALLTRLILPGLPGRMWKSHHFQVK